MEIKVLGPGCPKCQQTEKIVKEAVAEAGVDAVIGHVTDVMEIAGYGVFGTPAVVVDGEVKSVGKIPKKKDIKVWISSKG
jgi:small redox-active disulfide protein 2